MSPTLADFHERYQSLRKTRGPERRIACQAFCEAVIGAQRRGELGILPAAALIEEALQVPELPADETVARLRNQAASLQGQRELADRDRLTAWRQLVKGVESLPW